MNNRLQETFLHEESLETGSTGFLLNELPPIALKVMFGLSEGLDRGEVRQSGWLRSRLVFGNYKKGVSLP